MRRTIRPEEEFWVPGSRRTQESCTVGGKFCDWFAVISGLEGANSHQKDEVVRKIAGARLRVRAVTTLGLGCILLAVLLLAPS